MAAPSRAQDLPTGTVTFLFSDMEGSTKLVQRLGHSYRDLLDAHSSIVRGALARTDGHEVSTEGDSFFLVFPTPGAAVKAAVEIQRGLASHPWPGDAAVKVRVGLHTGEGRLGGDNYIGVDVNRVARIAAAGHGGQILLSGATRPLVERELPQGVSFRDLGEHRMKDLAHPEHLYQLDIDGLPSDFPPPKTLDARPNNLPAQLTSFVGREEEMAAVGRFLRDGTRLLTLTGAGGTGKTRLAIQVAADMLTNFEHGAYFVDLAPITDPDLVVSAIAEALGILERPERPLADTLAEELRDKEMLLLLDNFEQVLDAGPVVERLLREAPRIKALVTSRAVLHREGEQEFPVPPLSLPDPEQPTDLEALAQYEAVTLFIERATAIKPSFKVTNENAPAVAEICARLDGLPLAIELAASRVKLLAPGQLLDRLEQRLPLLTSRVAGAPDRRKTLRGTIEWSYDLLDEDEQRLFAHVSVFVGGGTLEAMEHVCFLAAGTDTIEGLASLVDKSLIRQIDAEDDQPRFVMLETIREYALERLGELGEREELARRHAAFFLGLAQEAEPNLTGPDAAEWCSRLTQEHDNIRAAVGRSIERGDAETGLRLAGAVWRFWQQRAHFAEARDWFDRLLGAPSASPRTSARVKGLTGLGGIAYWQGDYPAAEAAYAEAADIARELGDRRLLAGAVLNLSYMPALRGDIAAARRLTEEAVELFEETGQIEAADRSRGEAGYFLMMEGDLARARTLLEQNFAAAQESDDLFRKSIAHHVMGQLERLSGNLAEATAHYWESIRLCREMGNEAAMLEPLEALGSVASVKGDHPRGVRLLGAMQAARDALGGGPPPEWLMPADVLGEARRAIGDEAVERALEEGRTMTPEEAADHALSDE